MVGYVVATAALVAYTRYSGIGAAMCEIVRTQIPGGDLAAWYNPCSIEELASLKEKRVQKLLTWSTGLSVPALRWGTLEYIKYPIRTIPVKEGQFPSEQETYVGWDQGKVVEVSKENLLYSEQFGPCLAVLARGYKDGSDEPNYLALHHVFFDTSRLLDTLNDLVQRVGRGTVEVFISGGMEMSERSYREVHDIIKKSATKECSTNVVDDTFRIADLGTVYKCTDRCYDMSNGIDYVGFDSSPHHNPIQVIGITDRDKTVSDANAKVFRVGVPL
jgi:hypothetical protein